jgi:tetratricopeptide (TPR) repeat protein
LAKFRINDMKSSITDLNRVIAIDSNLSSAYFNRGLALLNMGKIKEAIADYNKAIERDPENTEIYQNRGFAKEKLGDSIGAKKDFNMATKINPGIQIILPLEIIHRVLRKLRKSNWQHLIK